MSNEAGRLIVFEGPDGTGKTVLTRRTAEHISSKGIPCELLSFPGREKGSLGSLVYELHHDPKRLGVETMDPTSVQMLHIAAHVDAIERRVRPMLQSGTWVVLDRFWWSTLVYGRILGARVESLMGMVDVERRHWRDIQPVRIFLISRGTPARETEPLDRHLELQEEYKCIANQHSTTDSPVFHISTDVTENESFGYVLEQLPLRA